MSGAGLSRSARPGRWIIHTRYGGRPWTVVVEPDEGEQVIYVVTAYGREIPTWVRSLCR